MNAFVRLLAALAALWAMCELAMPDGRQKRAARFGVSVLVMLSLVSGLRGLLGTSVSVEWDAPAMAVPAPDRSAYGRAVLRAMANQASGLCQRVAERAGYEARAGVYLREDGALHQISLALRARDEAPLMSAEEVAGRLAERLDVERSLIRVSLEAAGA